MVIRYGVKRASTVTEFGNDLNAALEYHAVILGSQLVIKRRGCFGGSRRKTFWLPAMGNPRAEEDAKSRHEVNDACMEAVTC